jgi:hypothetical protein
MIGLLDVLFGHYRYGPNSRLMHADIPGRQFVQIDGSADV